MPPCPTPTFVSGRTAVYSNPGTGPIADTSERRAQGNLKALIADLDLPGLRYQRMGSGCDQGLYRFRLIRGPLSVEVDMPGCPRSEVRALPNRGADLWRLWRLYVDGSSWAWPYALKVLSEALEIDPERLPPQVHTNQLTLV